MFRLVRFLIITFTLGRIKWLMRLNWLWRFIVFVGVTGWLSRKLRQMFGLDKKASTEIDSAWADALRYTPQASPAGAAAGTGGGTAPLRNEPATSAEPVRASGPAAEVSESRSEVIGTTADGSTETITIHEVDINGDTESIVRIEDDAGSVETLVTGSPVEDIDLANLGESASTDEIVADDTVTEIEIIEIDEIVLAEPDIETQADAEVAELIETLEASEPEQPEAAVEPEKPKRKRKSRAKPKAEAVAEPLETTDEDLDPDVQIDPDWVRGDGTHDCPESHPVKAKASSMIYYTQESGHYGLTIPDVCFASELDAESAGYRAPRR
jgi:hypothetical protein